MLPIIISIVEFLWNAAVVSFFSYAASMVEALILSLADKVVPASRIACSKMRKVLLDIPQDHKMQAFAAWM
jgi:hypothetical protein